MRNYISLCARINTILFILLLINGCVRVPKNDLANLSTSVECDLSTLPCGQELKNEWWKEFKDPVLDWLMESGLKLSPTLKMAEERLKAAHQIANQTRASLYPEIDATILDGWFSLSKNGFFRGYAPTVPRSVNDFIMGLSFSYEFDFWGKNRALFNAALSRTLAFAAERAQAELILTTSIAYTYAELQFLLLEKNILLQRETNQGTIDCTRQRRKENAIDTAIDKDLAKISVLDIQSLILQTEMQIDQLIHKLKALTGLDQNAELDVRFFELRPLVVCLPKNLPLDLISRRPDLIAQKALVIASSKEISAAKTYFYPNINLFAFAGLESVFWNKLFTADSLGSTVLPALNLPLFTAGRLKAQLREKVADYNTAVHTYNNLILQAAQEIADRLTDLSNLEKEIEVQNRSLAMAKSIAELTQKRFEYALDDQIKVRQAEDEVLKSKLILAELEYSKQLEAILLVRALGGGYGD